MAAPRNVEKVPINQRMLLTIYEAAAFSGLGINRVTEMLKEPGCPFVFFNGNRRMVKRKQFEQYISESLTV